MSANPREALDKLQLVKQDGDGFYLSANNNSTILQVLSPWLREWKPIETAPKGPIVLLYVNGARCTGFWVDAEADSMWSAFPGLYDFGPHTPTHWMPLPSPPDLSTKESKA